MLGLEVVGVRSIPMPLDHDTRTVWSSISSSAFPERFGPLNSLSDTLQSIVGRRC
jgi:hypothetical protein